MFLCEQGGSQCVCVCVALHLFVNVLQFVRCCICPAYPQEAWAVVRWRWGDQTEVDGGGGRGGVEEERKKWEGRKHCEAEVSSCTCSPHFVLHSKKKSVGNSWSSNAQAPSSWLLLTEYSSSLVEVSRFSGPVWQLAIGVSDSPCNKNCWLQFLIFFPFQNVLYELSGAQKSPAAVGNMQCQLPHPLPHPQSRMALQVHHLLGLPAQYWEGLRVKSYNFYSWFVSLSVGIGKFC